MGWVGLKLSFTNRVAHRADTTFCLALPATCSKFSSTLFSITRYLHVSEGRSRSHPNPVTRTRLDPYIFLPPPSFSSLKVVVTLVAFCNTDAVESVVCGQQHRTQQLWTAVLFFLAVLLTIAEFRRFSTPAAPALAFASTALTE